MGLLGLWTIEVSAPGDGTLLVPIEGLESQFVEVEPLYFRQVNGPFALLFREDDRGQITHLFTDLMPQYAAVKLAWYETPAFNMALALGCVLIFLTMIPVAVIYLIRKRRPEGEQKPRSGGARLAAAIAAIPATAAGVARVSCPRGREIVPARNSESTAVSASAASSTRSSAARSRCIAKSTGLVERVT